MLNKFLTINHISILKNFCLALVSVLNRNKTIKRSAAKKKLWKRLDLSHSLESDQITKQKFFLVRPKLFNVLMCIPFLLKNLLELSLFSPRPNINVHCLWRNIGFVHIFSLWYTYGYPSNCCPRQHQEVLLVINLSFSIFNRLDFN